MINNRNKLMKKENKTDKINIDDLKEIKASLGKRSIVEIKFIQSDFLPDNVALVSKAIYDLLKTSDHGKQD